MLHTTRARCEVSEMIQSYTTHCLPHSASDNLGITFFVVRSSFMLSRCFMLIHKMCGTAVSAIPVSTAAPLLEKKPLT